MAALNWDSDATGRGGSRPARAKGNLVLATGTFDFDSSYPTGGEDISGIWGAFNAINQIHFRSKNGYLFEADLTNKKVKAYVVGASPSNSPLSEVPNATNLSTVTGVPWVAYGS